MARVAVIAILLFAIPFIVYALYVVVRGRKAALQNGVMDKAPVRGLIIAGIICAVAGVIGFAIISQGGPDYVPPVGEHSTLERPAQSGQ